VTLQTNDENKIMPKYR